MGHNQSYWLEINPLNCYWKHLKIRSSYEFLHLQLQSATKLYTTIQYLFFNPIHPTLTPLIQLNRIDSFSILYSLATIYFILFGIYLATKAKSLIKKALARSVCSIVWLRVSSGNFQRFSSFVKWFHYWNWTRKPELLCPGLSDGKVFKMIEI